MIVARSNILCRGNREGSNPDALFSAPSSLYVGDTFQDEYTAKKKFYRSELTQEMPRVFRQGAGPTPHNPWPQHMPETSPPEDPKMHVKILREKWESAPKPYLPLNTSCNLFEKKIEYFDPRPRVNGRKQRPESAHPFKVNYGIDECFWKYPAAMGTVVRKDPAVKSDPDKAIFKPPGWAKLQGDTFSGYMSPLSRKRSSTSSPLPDRPPWRSSPVPLTTSPIMSILVRNIRP